MAENRIKAAEMRLITKNLIFILKIPDILKISGISSNGVNLPKRINQETFFRKQIMSFEKWNSHTSPLPFFKNTQGTML